MRKILKWALELAIVTYAKRSVLTARIDDGLVRYVQNTCCDQAPCTVETLENGGAALPNSAARTASSVL
jgi:hypothetical protein